MTVKEPTVLVGLGLGKMPQHEIDEYLDELAFLADTAGFQEARRYTQRLQHPDVKTFVGKGKLEEIKQYLHQNQIKTLVFDDDLSPSQLRNIEKAMNSEEFKVRVYDRSLLILDIFLRRAQTSQATTQVQLAYYQYLLPRLTRMWTHLERQRGGTGTRGGAGEKEIETDRRAIRNQISVLKGRLEKIEKQKQTQRKSRNAVVRVALVGYTNVGKSTLMNLLSKSEVLAEDKLFATVDATVRKVVFKGVPFLLSDTVGFIRKLPHHLIESFKSTLDEVREADVLLHVADISHPQHEHQIEVVKQTLIEIGAGNIPVLMVLNKIDKFEAEDENPIDLGELSKAYVGGNVKNAICISAIQKQNIDVLREAIFEMVLERHLQIYPNYVNPGLLSDYQL
ncbi:MAG TPA: GTPase HflX [Cyclobacteriaceae bacterium]|nr:GTPase HflX [Cyclobacteriaceae bacterium]